MALQTTGHIISIQEITFAPTPGAPGEPAVQPDPVAALIVHLDAQSWQPNPGLGAFSNPVATTTFYTTLTDAKNYSVGQAVTVAAAATS